MKRDKKVVVALWAAIEERHLTWDALADGTDITFVLNNKHYTINSKVVSCPRIIAMNRFEELLEDRAIQEVNIL